MTEERHYADGDAIIDGDSGDGRTDRGAGLLDIENNAPMVGHYTELPDVTPGDPAPAAGLPDVANTEEG